MSDESDLTFDGPGTADLPAKWEGADYLRRLGESTSALLRRVEQERDEALAAQARLGDRLTESAVRLAAYRLGRDKDRTELGHLRRERDQLRTDLTEALNELEQLHGGTT
jgi:hypothetical protein